MKTLLYPGISISDTSTLTDILMWADWYHQIGLLKDDEYKTYLRLVDILKPIIPKPNLLVVLEPTSIEELVEGVKGRGRSEESVFWEDGGKNLQILTARTHQLIDLILKDWGVNILPITVSPLKIFKDASLIYPHIYQIRERLNL